MRQRATRVIAWVVAVLMLATSLPTNLFGGSSRAEETVVDYSAPVQLPWNTSEPEKKPSVAYIMGNTALGMVTYSAVDETYIPQGTVPTAENETPSDAALAAAEAYGQEQGKTGRVALQFRLGSSDETWTPEGALRAVVSLNQNIDLNQNETLSLVRLMDEGEAVSMAARMMRGGNELYGVSFNMDALGSYALLGAYETVTESWNVVFWGPEGELVEARNVPAGMALGELPEAPAREGYIFTGWFAEDGSVAEKETPVGSDLFFHASYERDYPATVADARTEKVSVHVEVPEGALPADARFRMTEVDAEEYRETVEQALGGATGEILAVDLTFVGLDGTKYQPLKPVSVDVTLTGMENAEHLSVVHIADSGEAEIVYTGEPETVKMRGAEDQQTISFPASGFSVYAITGMIEQEVTIDGAAYKITVTYDSLAGIPEGAALDVKEVSADEYLDATAAALGWSEGDDVFYTKFLDISIVKDGVEIEPKTPVSVSIELLDVTDGAEALEVVHFGEEGHASKVEADANGEGLVTFTTDSFSVFGFGSILHSLLSWANDTVTYTLQGFSGLLNPTYSAIEVELEEGLEAINAYNVQSTLGSLLNALYVKVSTALELGNRESVVVYSVKDGAVENVLAEGSSINSSLSLGGADGFAVVKDTGYRRKDFQLGAVELSGMIPKAAVAEAQEADAESLDVEDDVLAVYDIKIEEEETEYQPDSEHPVEVSIAVDELEGREIQIWHIRDDGEKEQITEFEVVDGKVVFTASGFSVYAVVATTLTKTIDASDGNTYEIEVTYKSTSGIPMEGTELLVSELLPTDEGYEDYLAASASKVGAKAENIELSKIFDIRIVDENDHTAIYEPTGDVEVRIRVIGSRLADYANLDVLHFVEDETAEGLTVYDMNSTVDGETVQFTTDSFSVYAVTGYVLETTIDIEGQTYKVTATYNDHAGIPGDAKLNVSEMDVLSEEYVQYLNDTAEALGVSAGELGYLRLLDIAIVGEDGTEYTPNDQVQVSVELIDEIETGDLRVVHFGAETEELVAETEGDTVSFTTDSFSLFSFVDLTLIQSMADAVFGSTYTDQIHENDDIIVSGRMPRTAIVEINTAELEVIGAPVLVAYDIKIYAGPVTKALGLAWQPTDGALTVQLKSDAIDAEAANIYHMADEKADPELVAENIAVEEHTVVFDAESFSVYVIIDHEGGTLVTPRIMFHYINYDHTVTYPGNVMTYSAEPYNFLDSAGEYLATQIVKTGEALVDVITPPVYNQQYFNGWYVVDMKQDLSSFNTTSRRFTGQISYTIPNNPTHQVFNETITISMGAEDADGIPLTWEMNGQTYTKYADAEGCAHIYLAPLYANFNYVNFYDYNGYLIARKLLVLDSNGFSSMLVSDMEATSPIEGTNNYFMGWSSVAYKSNNNSQTPGNTVPLYKDGYKQTVYITLYGGTNYADTHTLDIYYGGESYNTTTELANGTLKFREYDTSVTGGDVNLYAEYEYAHWLRFIAGESGWGALFVPADYLVGNAAATTLPTTSRTGYSFDGWYSGYQDSNGTIWYYEKVTDELGNVLTNGNYMLIDYAGDGEAITVENYQGTKTSIDYTQTGTVSSTGLQMTADSYLFAKWTSKATATYKVIIWQQKVTDSANSADKHYEYLNSYIETAQATKLLTLPEDSEYLNRDYYGFHLGKYDQNVWIDPQGTSVVNVYYDRDVHTYLFRVPGSGETQYTFATDENGTQYGYINGEYIKLEKRQIGTKTEYFLTQTQGSNTEYTGTIYDSNGNTVATPAYGTTYYRTRNTNWWGSFTGVSDPLYWNSRTVPTYEWFVPVMVNEYYEDDENGTYGNIGTEENPIYVPIEVSGYTETTTYRDAYVLTASLTAGGQYLIVNGNSARTQYALRRNNTTVATDDVLVQSANGMTWIETSQVESTSVWTAGSGYTFQNSGYYLGRESGRNGALVISTNPAYKEWEWNGSRLSIENNRNIRYLRYDYSYTLDSDPGTVYLYKLTQNAISETGQVPSGWQYDNNGTPTPYEGTHRYSAHQVMGEGSTVYTGTRFKPDSSSYQTVYVINELYGHNIANNFPITASMSLNGVDYSSARWTAQNSAVWNSDYAMVYIDTMTNEDVWFLYSPPESRPTKTMLYYVTTQEGDNPEVTYNGVGYTLYKRVDARYYFVSSEDLTAITGFTYLTSDNSYFNTNGRTAQSSSNETFRFFYSRNNYTLTFATNYPGEAQFTSEATASSNSEITVPYETPLTDAQYAAPTFNAPDHFIFDGWYEDASGTTPFDWDQTMPAANKVVYAKWYPVYYLIQIDPDGGVIAGSDNQNESSYFWLQYGQTIGQYTTKREYIQATEEEAAELGPGDTYYYRYVKPTINKNGTIAEHSKYDPYPNVLMWESSLGSDKDAEGIRPTYYRMAKYVKVSDYHTDNDAFYKHLKASGLTEEQAADWDARYVDTSKVYRLVTDNDPKWVFVGWYRDGHPYDFANKVTENIKLKAVWRQAGNYYLYYNPIMEINGVVGTLAGNAYDPADPSVSANTGYIDKATTHAAIAPDHITGPSGDNNTYVFEGWRVVGPNGNPLDENGNVMKEEVFEADANRYLFQPGDEITIRSEQAHLVDGHHVVELRAYYKKIEDSSRYPATVQTILDANDAYAGYIDPSAASWPAWANPGNSAVNTEDNLDTQSRPTQIAFGDAEINQAIHLINYRDFFINENGDFLLGFDPQPNPEQCFGGPYIPKYAADAVIGIDDPVATNILYAIWEPMVYVTFVNHTGAPVTVSLDSLDGESTIEATIINNATQTYDRTKITAMDSVTIGAGQTIRLVLPKGMVPNSNPETGRELTLTIKNSHMGFKMSGTKQVGDTAATQLFGGDPEDPSSPALEYGQSQIDTQALIRSYTGIIYTLTENPLPVAYFDPNGGTWTDTDHTTYNDQDWNNATKPNGTVFRATTEQGGDRTQYKIKIEQFMKPASDPRKDGNYEFLGWTTDPNVARFVRVNGDFSLTIEQLTARRDVAGAGTDDYVMYDALLTMIEEYKAAFHITNVTNLLHVVENYALWNFNNDPAGTTYYAVYAKTAEVRYHIMYADGVNDHNHRWGLGNVNDTTTTGQAGTIYNRSSVTETQDNHRHYVWSRTVVKGRSIIKPPAPSHYNENYTFLYWLKDDATHTVGSTNPSSVVAFSFVEPITEDLDLYTSWTEMNYTTLQVVKVVDGAQSSTDDLFNLRYDVITYKYSYVGGRMNRAEYGEHDSTGIVLQGTTGNVPGTEILNHRNIRLYYWTDAEGAFYCQALNLREENLSDSGYELVITDNEGRNSSRPEDVDSPLVFVNNEDGTNYYKYYPVANHHVESNADYYISYGGEKEGKPVWRYRKNTEYYLYFWNNRWYSDYQCGTPTGSPFLDQQAVFTNTKNAKIRFVKTDENGYDRLNGAMFTISKINENSGTAMPQVLTFNTGYVRTASETAGRNGRFILAPGTTIAENSPIQMDTDHNELVFTETGTYRLTETKAPSGYSLPSELENTHLLYGENYVDIEVTASGISIGGGNSAIATTEPLTQLNIGEFDRDNEYAVVIKNVPKTVYFKLQKVDTAGNPILTGIPDGETATSGQATFTASGSAAASGVWVSLGSFSTIITGEGAEAYTDVKVVPYGTYTVTETLAPEGYRTADATTLTITDDHEGNAVLTATGGNVFGDVRGEGTPEKPFIVRIQDEEIGYNLELSKTAVNDPEDGVDRVYTVTVTAQGDTADKVAGKTYNVVKVDANNASTNTSVLFSAAGAATVTIKKDEKVTLRSLPRGSYLVSEDATATNESTGVADPVPFTTAIVVMEPATSHTLVTSTTNTTPPFTLSNNAQARITNTFGHTLSVSKTVAGGFASETDSFGLAITGRSITHYTYTGSRSDDGGATFTVMNFTATPTSGEIPGSIEFTTRNNNPVNGGPITGKTRININGILDGTYKFTETVPAELDGYVLTAQVNDVNVSVTNNEFNVQVSNADALVDMTNTRNAVAPTGFGFSLIPFLLMAVAGMTLIVVVVIGRKHRREEE